MSCAACDAGLRCVAHSPLIAELCDDEPGIDGRRRCTVCREPMEPEERPGRPRKFCSEACTRSAAAAYGRERRRRAGQRPLNLRRAEAEERRERFRAALAEHGGYAQAGRALGVSRQCVHAALNDPRRSRGAA